MVSMETLGNILREQQRPECVSHYEEAVRSFRRIGARREEAGVTFNLGRAYLEILGLRDLDQAEHWYRTSLQLCDQHDKLGRARCLGELRHLALERARSAEASIEQLLSY